MHDKGETKFKKTHTQEEFIKLLAFTAAVEKTKENQGSSGSNPDHKSSGRAQSGMYLLQLDCLTLWNYLHRGVWKNANYESAS